MKVLSELEASDGCKVLAFFCPGCGYDHSFRVASGSSQDRPIWTWNGDMEKPTFTPSLLVNGSTEQRCHSFVTNGQIQYLGDCWHELKNTTVDLQEIDW